MTVAIPLVDVPQEKRRGLGRLQGGKAALPLASVALRAKVIDRIAEVSVEEKFHNPLSETIEAVYLFPLGGGCAVSRFEMQIGARTLQARLEERGEARRQYQEALGRGQRAALLEQERDDIFTVQAGNIAPGEEVTVRLTYSERLPFYEDGRSELRLPLVIAPRYVGGEELPREQAGHGVVADSTQVPDASRISPPRLAPGFDPRVALTVEAELYGTFAELECSQHTVRTATGPESARVQLSKDREPLDRDFVLRWRLSGQGVRSQLLVHDGFAMVSLLPPARQGFLGAPRDLVFALDRSGSMEGPKLASASRACALLLRTLSPRDRFAVQAFDDTVEWMPGGFLQADEGGIAQGEKWLREISAHGGTQLDLALAEALAKMGAGPSQGRVQTVVLLTDGQVGDESSVLARVQRELGGARIFTVGIDTAVNSGFLRRLAALGGGTSTLVEPGARLEEALQAVGREIGTPLVTDLEISGEISDAAPARLPDLFAGRASAAFFRHASGSVEISGRWSDGKKFRERLEPRTAPLAALDHLWARTRVADLEDAFRAGREESVKQEIVALSVKHAVLTRFTAFVVVDPEVVNKGGTQRTVVQPVAMPDQWGRSWEGAPVDAAQSPRLFKASASLGGAPVPTAAATAQGAPRRAASYASAAAGQKQQRSLGSIMRGILQGNAPMVMEGFAGEERPTPAQRERVRQALESFVQAFAQAKASGAAEPLEKARDELLKALSEALAIATAVPLLQAFLRSAAVETIAALKAGVAGAAVRHVPALQAALLEARGPLEGSAGKPAAGSFWEASI